MNNIEQEFKKLFGDMYLSESETALRIFEYGYKAGAAAENEACAKVAEAECCKCADAAAAIRARMKND